MSIENFIKNNVYAPVETRKAFRIGDHGEFVVDYIISKVIDESWFEEDYKIVLRKGLKAIASGGNREEIRKKFDLPWIDLHACLEEVYGHFGYDEYGFFKESLP